MADKFRNKYRIPSNRMPQWDYSGNGIYFITIVTQNRECNLGQIVKRHGCASLQYSDFGKIVNDEWLKSFEIRNELFLDEYIIMPNHLHAILILNKTNNERSYDSYDSHVETHGRASLQINQSNQSNEQTQKQQFDRKPKSISSFVAGFKSAINSKIDNFIDEHNLDILKYNRNNHFFQPNYHDHIIRNDSEYQRIKEYIVNNPSKWNDDKFNPTNKITK
jgi:REP element-mobilizing transposase RayT